MANGLCPRGEMQCKVFSIFKKTSLSVSFFKRNRIQIVEMWSKESENKKRFWKSDFKVIRNKKSGLTISYSTMYFSLISFWHQHDHRQKVNFEVQKYSSKANKIGFGEL